MTTKPTKHSAKSSSLGFSLVELTVAVAVIAIVAAIGFKGLARINDGTRVAKLEGDIKTLNRAAKIYRASGGSFTGITLPQDVINKMKTEASDGTKNTVVGLTGSFVDPRTRAVMVGDSAGSLTRAVWNSTKELFELSNAGVGAKEFALDGALVATVKEDRNTALAYGTEDNWVWDYTDVVAARNTPNTSVVTGHAVPPNPTAGGSTTAVALPAPTFSIPSGTYAAANYPMTLQLTIPATYAGQGQIFYQIDGGSWQIYNNPLPLPISPTTTVSAFVASVDPDLYSDSPHAAENYLAQFDTFSGSADGQFSNPQGPSNMDFEILDDGHRFEWGTEDIDDGFVDPNHMVFEGASFENVDPETEFLVGSLTYFNGTTVADTTAESVTLNVTLDLTSAGIQEELEFGFTLESTINHDWQTADENADFVRLNNVASQFSTVLNGETYYLVLRFGEHTANGFTTIDQFHVHEGAMASGNVYGRFTDTPPTATQP